MTTINAQINPSTKIVAKHITLHNVTATDVGLANVDNTSDLNKPVSTAQQSALDLKADQATTYTKAEVDNNIANLVDTAPATLDTLNELAAALGDDANFATSVTDSIATKASQTNLDTHTDDTTNPHNVTATQVGLGNVTNESKATMFTDPSFTGDLTNFSGETRFNKIVRIKPEKGLGLQLFSSGSNNSAVSLQVQGPTTVGHDLFQRSGFTNGFGDGSNHFHSLIDINRIEQEAEGDVKNTQRVQERYYAIQDNLLPNSKAVFWAQHRVARPISTTVIDTSTATLDVSLLQNSSNRNANNQVFFVSNTTPLNKSEELEITLNSHTLSTGDNVRMQFGQSFAGPIVAAALFGKVTTTTTNTFKVELYGGNYKTTSEVPLGTSQTALTFDEVVLETIGTNTIVQSGNETNLQLYSKTNFTPNRLKDETVKATWSVAHGLVKNEHCTLITDGRGDLEIKQAAYVLDPDPDSDGLSAILVYGRRIKQFDLGAFTAFGSANWTLHKGSIDGIHDDTLGDNLINFNANNKGEYTAYQIGPGSQTDADCIAIGKNVYNKDASTIKIGYDNAMLDVRSDGIVVDGDLTVSGNFTLDWIPDVADKIGTNSSNISDLFERDYILTGNVENAYVAIAAVQADVDQNEADADAAIAAVQADVNQNEAAALAAIAAVQADVNQNEADADAAIAAVQADVDQNEADADAAIAAQQAELATKLENYGGVPSTLTLISDAANAVKGYGLTEIPSDWQLFQSSLKGLSIGQGVTTIGNSAFYYCSGFTGSLTIPDSVTSIGGYAFYNCRGFTGSPTIPDSVTTIGGGAFQSCSGFTGSLTIPDSVTTIGNAAFYYCSGFTGSLTIPDSVTSIGNYAFSGCTGLTNVNCYVTKTIFDQTNVIANTSVTTIHVLASDVTWTAGAGQTIGGKTGIEVIKDLT